MSIHSTAIIGKDFQIGSNVQIGPYCVIEDNVIIGNDNILKSHVFILKININFKMNIKKILKLKIKYVIDQKCFSILMR